MEVNMRLHSEPFNHIKRGVKKVEFRLSDAKRSQIKSGDFITFSLRGDIVDKVRVKVLGVCVYANFDDLYDGEEALILEYYTEGKGQFIEGLEEYYPREEQVKFPPVAIRFELV
jgi:ASC-1-like (ASCH) protein